MTRQKKGMDGEVERKSVEILERRNEQIKGNVEGSGEIVGNI